MATYSLKTAIKHAKRIRRNLLRLRFGNDLCGACGLSSVMLANALNDPSILRARDGHVWTVVKGYVIDITATQFNPLDPKDSALLVRGVYVSRKPLHCHRYGMNPRRGLSVFQELLKEGWYTKDDHGRWKTIANYGVNNWL